MSNRYKFRDAEGLYFCTLTLVGWIDLFSRKSYRDILVKNLNYCSIHKGLNIHAYVFMTNHIHLILSKRGGKEIWEILRDFKSFSAKEFLKTIDKSEESRRNWLLYLFRYFAGIHKRTQEYMLWQHDNHPIELFSKGAIKAKLNYIHDNPVRANFVRQQADWIYSSALDYEGRGKGEIEIQKLEIVYTL